MKFFFAHPNDTTLVAFDAAELIGRRHERVAAHLRDCVRCQNVLRFIRRVAVESERIEVPAPPDGLLSRIIADRIAGERVLLPAGTGESSHAGRSRRRMFASIAAAAAIAVALTLSVRSEGLSAASGLVHNIVHKVGVLRSLVDAKHDSVPAQTTAPPLATPIAIPVYAMNDVEAESREHLKSISTIKVFSDGRVLVHDPSGRSLRLYDSTLASSTLIAGQDSGKFKYGPQVSILIPYWGDSALFLDYSSSAFLVLDANGSALRTIALPIGSDWMSMLSGQPALDPLGRLYYRRPMEPPRPVGGPGPRLAPVNADSSAIVRADFETRTVDTLAFIATGGVKRTPTTLASGRQIVYAVVNPAPTNDDWTVLADGSVAILRGRDYHVDWIRPDGTRSSSGKLPFDWRKLDDVAKQQILDSAQTAIEATMARSAPSATKALMREHFELVGIDKLPDYFPPLRLGSRRADLAGNLWIPPTTTLYATRGGLLYDDVTKNGTISRRVLLKPGYSVAGFGPNGSIYMIAADSTGLRIARARVGAAPHNH